jgi:hypothetical protein
MKIFRVVLGRRHVLYQYLDLLMRQQTRKYIKVLFKMTREELDFEVDTIVLFRVVHNKEYSRVVTTRPTASRVSTDNISVLPISPQTQRI